MKWIDIIEIPNKLKTRRYKVVNKETQNQIGTISWYSPFRKYSFMPMNNIVFESTCLDDISAFLKKLMEERKARPPKLPEPEWFPSHGEHVMAPPQPGENAREAVVTFIYGRDTCRLMDPDTKTEWDATIKSLTPIKE